MVLNCETYKNILREEILYSFITLLSSSQTRKYSVYKRFMNKRADHKSSYQPTDLEHVANIVTHGIWVIPSLIASSTLFWSSHSVDHFYCSIIYGIALSTLFFVSTTFHCICYTSHLNKESKLRKWKDTFHLCDRAAIYIFIGGSYTPWLVLKEMGYLGEHMRWIIWMLCLFGVSFQYTFHEQCKWLETSIYVFTALFPAVAVFSMRDMAGVHEMLWSGAIYLVGVVFFKLDGRVPCAHAIWHLFVVVAATLQWISVYLFLYSGDHRGVMMSSES